VVPADHRPLLSFDPFSSQNDVEGATNMDSLLQRNLKAIDTTVTNLSAQLNDVSRVVEPDYRVINEIELHKQGSSSLFAVLGVEQIDALKTFQGELRRNTAVVVEPDLRRLKHLLSNRDLTDLVSDKNVVFVAGESVASLSAELERYFSFALIDDIKTLNPVPDRSGEFSDAREELKQFRKHAQINLDTVDEFLTDWYCYFPRNLSHFLNGPDLNQFEGHFGDETLTIVGPGPSIDDFTEELNELTEGRIIALDTALPVLNELEITPDIVVSIDVGESTMDFLEPFPDEAVLIAPSYMNPRALEAADRVILFDSLFPPNQWLNPGVRPTGMLAISGTVASAALDLALTLRPSECYMLGMDLTAPGMRTYSKYSTKYTDMLRSLNRFTSLPNQCYESLKDRNLLTARGTRGSVLTTEQYLNWREIIEDFVGEARFPFFQIGDQVLPIEGVRQTKRVSRLNPRSSAPLPINAQSRVTDPDELSRRAGELLERIQELVAEVETLRSRKKRGDSIVSDWLSLVGEFGQSEEFLRYFQWEIDRVTSELKNVDPDDTDRLRDVVNQQFERWDRLLTETRGGIKTLT
jgi:hypothetical protein